MVRNHAGRPRRYCRDSHRQRAYEARRLGWRMDLTSAEATVSAAALNELGDRLTVLEAALEDVEQDLKVSPNADAYRAAFEHLYEAAAGLRGRRLRVKGVGS